MKLWPFSRKQDETRASGGYTQQMMAARHAAIVGNAGVAELSAAVQECVSLWESGLSLADVTNAPDITPAVLGLMARQLALSGNAVFLLGDAGLVPAMDWDVKTVDGVPRAYRLGLPDIGGGRNVTVLADEVLHVRIGVDATTPWAGTAPLKRASMTTGLLQAVEQALTGVYRDAPMGSQVVPFPESQQDDTDTLAASFRGQRGRVLLRESVNVTAAGGPTPTTDWKATDLTPDLDKSRLNETLTAATDSVLGVYSVLPCLLAPNAPGTGVREAQRHLAQWQLQPIGQLIAQEATNKLSAAVTVDTLGPLQAYDAGGQARAMSGIIKGLAEAKAAGLTDEQVTAAMQFAGIDQ